MEVVCVYTDSSCRMVKGHDLFMAPYQIFAVPPGEHAFRIGYYTGGGFATFFLMNHGVSSEVWIDTPAIVYEAGYLYQFSFIDKNTLELSRTGDGQTVEVVRTFTSIEPDNPNLVSQK